jgi:hypothetical protein
MTTNPQEWGWWIGGFLFGFVIGLAMSLTYGWVLDPRPASIGPANLAPAGQDMYIRLVALAFFHDRNMERAMSRIAKLENPNFQNQIITLTERYIQENQDIRDIRALVTLADTLGPISGEMLAFLSTPTPLPTAIPTSTPTNTPVPPMPTATDTPTPTNTRPPTPTRAATATPTEEATPTITSTPTVTSTSTLTLTPSQTPTPGPGSPYGVATSMVACDSANGGLLKIYIRDRLGVGVTGVEIQVSWPGGRDTLFTGFKPEIDPGYADFQMEADKRYRIELITLETTGSPPEISSGNQELCPDLPETTVPSWEIIFQQGAN